MVVSTNFPRTARLVLWPMTKKKWSFGILPLGLSSKQYRLVKGTKSHPFASTSRRTRGHTLDSGVLITSADSELSRPALYSGGECVIRGDERILWLPPNYRGPPAVLGRDAVMLTNINKMVKWSLLMSTNWSKWTYCFKMLVSLFVALWWAMLSRLWMSERFCGRPLDLTSSTSWIEQGGW